MTNTIVLKFIIIIMILDLTEIDKWMTTRCQGVPDDAKRSRYLMDKHFCPAHLVWFQIMHCMISGSMKKCIGIVIFPHREITKNDQAMSTHG